VADSLSVSSKSIRKRLRRPEDFFTRTILKHIAGDGSFVFEADTHALRKRLPPKRVLPPPGYTLALGASLDSKTN